MRQITIVEYGTIRRDDLGQRLLRGLQTFDELHARDSGETIFDWSFLHHVKAKSHVGVVQIPGLAVEILPKIDDATSPEARSTQETSFKQARHNLLYMLSVAGKLPFHERDLAALELQNLPMWEALIRVFVRRLLQELRRGQQHQYVYREERLGSVRGRILLSQQCSRSKGLEHHLFVGYDEFQNDTWLNRILKAACTRLLPVTRLSQTQQFLRESLLELADVKTRHIEPHHFDKVQMDRNSERFAELLEFCRLVFLGATPSPQSGQKSSFSLLFPMETLFEEFVGGILRRNAEYWGLQRSQVHLQAQSRRKWLLRDSQERGRFRLKPDVIIDGPDGQPAVILDTKWKRLLSDQEDSKNGVSQADIYQLYAYSHRYRCDNNILLFPKVSGVTCKSYKLDGSALERRLKVEFLDLNFNLRIQRKRLLDEIAELLFRT
ncbi:MAG TPA: McrC family protein [Planctomicrobium sp.]|nr:McrC family protein [Planctomicrobium sp.]